MSDYSPIKKLLAAGSIVVLLMGSMPYSAWAKTLKADCTKKSELQKVIDAAQSGDEVEITGICMGNILIKDKAVTLIGSPGPGPHGIAGIAEDTDGIRIENSRGTHIEGLQISNPHFTGIRIRFMSVVTMTDCEVNGSGAGEGTGIWVQEMSNFRGLRLQLNENRRGLGAYFQSMAFCFECDLNDNTRWAATAWRNSLVSLLDSTVTGQRGINAIENSYIDIDCLNHDSVHDCSLSAAGNAGYAYNHSNVWMYEAGEFSGRILAIDYSKAQVLGSQQSNPGSNIIEDNSSLRVEAGATGHSALTGSTEVTGFSNALFYGSNTILDGSLACDSGGDAWVEPGVDLTDFTVSGCIHVP